MKHKPPIRGDILQLARLYLLRAPQPPPKHHLLAIKYSYTHHTLRGPFLIQVITDAFSIPLLFEDAALHFTLLKTIPLKLLKTSFTIFPSMFSFFHLYLVPSLTQHKHKHSR